MFEPKTCVALVHRNMVLQVGNTRGIYSPDESRIVPTVVDRPYLMLVVGIVVIDWAKLAIAYSLNRRLVDYVQGMFPGTLQPDSSWHRVRAAIGRRQRQVWHQPR